MQVPDKATRADTDPGSRAVTVNADDLRAVLDEFVPDDPRLGSGAGDRLHAALGRPHRHRGAAVGDAPSEDVTFERQHLRALTDWVDQQPVPHGLPADVASALQAGCDTVDGVRRVSGQD
jgi:hypothetical protein